MPALANAVWAGRGPGCRPMRIPMSMPMRATRVVLLIAVLLLAPMPLVTADPSLGRLFFLPSERASIDAASHASEDACAEPACLPHPGKPTQPAKKSPAAHFPNKSPRASPAANLSGVPVRLDGFLTRADGRRGAVVWLNGARMMPGAQKLHAHGLLVSGGQGTARCLRPGQTYDPVTETLLQDVRVSRVLPQSINPQPPAIAPEKPANGAVESALPNRRATP